MGDQTHQSPQANQIYLGEPGAQISQTYLRRRQRVIAMNETDLHELLTFDGLQQALAGAGIFMLSGGLWLGIEKTLEQEVLELTALIGVCIASSFCGLILTGAGAVLFFMRRRKIKKIFSETEEI